MIKHTPPKENSVPVLWVISDTIKQPILLGCKRPPEVIKQVNAIDDVMLVNYALDYSHMIPNTCDSIVEFMKQAPTMAPVSVQGMQEITDDNIGSWRTTMFNVGMADQLWHLFKSFYPLNKTCDKYTPTDWWQRRVTGNKFICDQERSEWKAIGVSPMLRFMQYKAGGKHSCHYDAAYIYPDDNYRTLVSFVIYLSTNKTGATVFIDDNQSHLPVWDRDHEDWSMEPTKRQIMHENYPQKGSVLFFDHRIPHMVSPYLGDEGDRTIIRGDIIYQAT